MAKPKRRRQQSQAQAYDTTLKTWVQEQARDILPVFLPGAMYEETLNVEIIRPAMRVDKVFKVMYRELDHILHLEFESGSDNDMPSRLLTYHAVLYQEHHLPVISMIVYPFRTRMAVSPWREMSREETLLTFHFLTLPLFTLDAERYVREHVLCMYPLLPTMQGGSHRCIDRASYGRVGGTLPRRRSYLGTAVRLDGAFVRTHRHSLCARETNNTGATGYVRPAMGRKPKSSKDTR